MVHHEPDRVPRPGTAPMRTRRHASGTHAETGTDAEFRRALDHGEFRLHYQPVVDARTGEIVGAEALLRWQHPEWGLLYPGDFLEAADRSSLTVEIAQWVAAEAIAECAQWPEPWFVSVNVSPRQLLLGTPRGIGEHLRSSCANSGLDSSRLWVELTEQAVSDELEIACSLATLSDLGIQLAIDDLGTGNSSLGRLRRLPFGVAKIDRSLVGDPTDPTSTLILRLTCELARACGTRVVAEGVETPEQLALLRDLGCDLVQGFHLARPMDAAELRALSGRLLGTADTESHVLALYDDEAELDRLVVELVRPALTARASAVVIARPERLAALDRTLRAAGLPLADLRRDRRLLELDAAELLEAILVDGLPDVTRLASLTAEILRRLSPGTGPLRIHSELAALLWERGSTSGALRLEELSAGLDLPHHRLLCTYPTSGFGRRGGSVGFRDLCAQHHRASPGAAAVTAAAGTGLGQTALLHHELGLVHDERGPFRHDGTVVGAA